jgi:hypothetical protein
MQSAEYYRHLAAHTRRMARANINPELSEQLSRQARECDDMAYGIDRECLKPKEMEHEGTGKQPPSE